MGAGKTSVGRECAVRLGMEFADTDALVESATGISVGEIFEKDGEARFRALEHAEVVHVCRSAKPMVIACGGGVVEDPANRRALKAAGLVVWLRATSSVLGERVRPQGATRPLIASVDGSTQVETLQHIATKRDSAYREVMDVSVDTDALNIDEVADAVVRAFESESA